MTTETKRDGLNGATIAVPCPTPCSLTVHVGELLFEFSSYENWVAKAGGWFAKAEVRGHECICVDSVGRLCRVGKQFVRARDEGTFPIRVYRMVIE